MHYRIKSRVDMENPDVPGVRVEARELSAYLNELTDRALPWPSLSQTLRRTGRVYVATNAGSEGRCLYGRGIIIIRVNDMTLGQG